MLRRLFFDLWYRVARPPWDTGVPPPELRRAVEEEARPPGRALDLGCGTGTSAVYLAQRGWEAVGVDFAPRAIALARRRAAGEGLADRTRFLVADVTALPELGAFDLALDVGCFHSIPSARRAPYVAGLARALRPGATYLLYAFLPGDGRRGVREEEVRALFGGDFEVVQVEQGTGRPSAWYRLRRRSTATPAR